MSSPLPKESSSRPVSAQLESEQYLNLSTNKRHSSVDNVLDEIGSENDARSFSSSHSTKSMYSPLKRKASLPFQHDSQKQNSETTPPTTSATAPTQTTTTSSSPTVTVTSMLAISTELTLGVVASPNNPVQQGEIATTEAEPAHVLLDSRPDSLSSMSDNGKTSSDYFTTPASNATVPASSATVPASNSTIPVSNTTIPLSYATTTAAGTTNSTTDIPVAQSSANQRPSVAPLRNDIFPKNIAVPSPKTSLPRIGGRVETTPQLVFLINLLREDPLLHASSEDNDGTASASHDILDAAYYEWVQTQHSVEKDRIVKMPSKLVAAFIIDASKDSTSINEIVFLGPVLEREDYRTLLECFIKMFESRSFDLGLLQGLVHLVESASPGILDSDDFVKILAPIGSHLKGIHHQSLVHPYHLALGVSRILDVMAKHRVKDLDRALQFVSDDETTLEAFLQHSSGLMDGLIKISSLVQLTFEGFSEGVEEGQKVIEEAASTIKSAFEVVYSLFESGRGVVDSVREGLGSGHKRLWYLAFRGATVLVREGRLAELNKLIIEAPCRRNPLFQMGICQLLGEIADDETWDVVTRKQAVDFIEVLYRDDQDWGQDKSVKQWMWTILCRISSVQEQAVKVHASVWWAVSKWMGTPSCRASIPYGPDLPRPNLTRFLT
ncbi:hypothetical protein BGZ91_007101, partial [Linnemannia elongata]